MTHEISDLCIIEPNGEINMNLALRAIIRKYKYKSYQVAERLGVHPSQVCRWINYKVRIGKGWGILIYNEYYPELSEIITGMDYDPHRSIRK